MAKKFLTLNIGASAVALAEYEASGSRLTLLNYGLAPLAAPLDAGNASTILVPALMDIVREKGIKPGKVAISLSGQMVFPRIATIPFAGNDQAKFEQMIRYEVEQNVPFPIDDMVCDRQVLGDTENGDKSVLIVAAKIEQVESITNAVQSAGFEPSIIDVAPFALTNAFHAANSGDDGCAVLLDIGAKTTSLVIVEGEKLYNRTIPVAGNTITKDIAQAFGCGLDEAERIKLENAYVAMGGVMEDEDATRDRISKICRTVLTRINAEVSRSINFYRSQQGGGVPQKLYLTGGTSRLPQIGDFFQTSLNIDVEYLNPFEVIGVGGSVDVDALEIDGAVLSATAGLALHEAGLVAINLDLMPPSVLEARAEVKRIPFIAIGAACLVAASVCAWLKSSESIDRLREDSDSLASQVNNLQGLERQVKEAQVKAEKNKQRADELAAVFARRDTEAVRMNIVRKAIGSDLWIEKWEEKGEIVKVTIRGWEDRVAKFVNAEADKKSVDSATKSEAPADAEKAEDVAKAESVEKPAEAKAEGAESAEEVHQEPEGKATAGRRERATGIVLRRLREHDAIVTESVKVSGFKYLDDKKSVEEFAVEMQFK